MIRRKETKEIILHCSATPEGRDIKAKDIRKWHKDKGWEDIGYNRVIDLDGTIEQGRPDDVIGSHCLNHNNKSIGICYIGGCDKNMNAKDTRTKEQKESLCKLVKYFIEKYHLTLNDVYCHNNFDKRKACPSFTIDSFKRDYLIEFKL